MSTYKGYTLTPRSITGGTNIDLYGKPVEHTHSVEGAKAFIDSLLVHTNALHYCGRPDVLLEPTLCGLTREPDGVTPQAQSTTRAVDVTCPNCNEILTEGSPAARGHNGGWSG